MKTIKHEDIKIHHKEISIKLKLRNLGYGVRNWWRLRILKMDAISPSERENLPRVFQFEVGKGDYTIVTGLWTKEVE